MISSLNYCNCLPAHLSGPSFSPVYFILHLPNFSPCHFLFKIIDAFKLSSYSLYNMQGLSCISPFLNGPISHCYVLPLILNHLHLPSFLHPLESLPAMSFLTLFASLTHLCLLLLFQSTLHITSNLTVYMCISSTISWPPLVRHCVIFIFLSPTML